MSQRFSYELPFGAALRDRSRARFRLWAPAQQRVDLAIEDAAPQPMTAAGGWFEAEIDCAPGARYRFQLQDGRRVPDPASRFQPDDVHGPSAVIDPCAYQWRHERWSGRPWEETVIYELHAGVCGGYDGVAARLPQLAELGVTALELMPIGEFSGARNWGYDGVLPYAPESTYGAPERLKALVDAAHGHGLMMFLDVVYNHFGPDGNFLPLYAPQFFRDDVQTPWGAAIDFRRREVRDFFIHNALYWLLEYRFDGLRFDAVHAIHDDSFMDELSATVHGRVEAGRHVHLMLENEHNEACLLERAGRSGFDAQWNDDAHNAAHVLLTGETEGYYRHYADAPAARLARCLAEGFAYQGETPAGECPAASADPNAGKRGSRSAHLPPTAFIFFLQNHDQVGNRALGERLITLVAPPALRAAAALQLLCPYIPLLFMGEEWGSRTPFLYFTDFRDRLAAAVREGRRREFARFKAFADPARRSAIPDPNSGETFCRSMLDEPGDDQWREFYRQLLRLRARHLTPRLRGAAAMGAAPLGQAGVTAGWRLGDGAVLRIAANFGAHGLRWTAAPEPLLFESQPGAASAAAAGELPGFASCVWLDPRS